MNKTSLFSLTFLTLLFVGSTFSFADVTTDSTGIPGRYYIIRHELTLPVAPEAAFDAMTGDISPWWDHTFSGKPARLFIEPKPGGGFFEIFDDQGNGVRHAVVTYADRGKLLRFEGPLGLAGNAIQMVTTWKYEADGEGTKLSAEIHIGGEIDFTKAKIVDRVWRHFLVEQLLPYLTNRKGGS